MVPNSNPVLVIPSPEEGHCRNSRKRGKRKKRIERKVDRGEGGKKKG